MLIKQKSQSTRNLTLRILGELPILFSTKVNLLHTLYSAIQSCCFLHLIKQKLFAENTSKISNLEDSGISLPVFFSRTNLKLHNSYVTPKMVKKVIMNHYFSKTSGTDCNTVEVLRNCELELSYILAELFNKCLKESYFLDCWEVSSSVSALKNVGERSAAKDYHTVSLLSVVSKVFQKVVNNRIIDHLEKCGLFSDF